jgi:hypothetical protein
VQEIFPKRGFDVCDKLAEYRRGLFRGRGGLRLCSWCWCHGWLFGYCAREEAVAERRLKIGDKLFKDSGLLRLQLRRRFMLSDPLRLWLWLRFGCQFRDHRNLFNSRLGLDGSRRFFYSSRFFHGLG